MIPSGEPLSDATVAGCAVPSVLLFCVFFFNETAPTEISTLPLHDALPIYVRAALRQQAIAWPRLVLHELEADVGSEEHTSELQSPCNLVCRLLLEKKK